MLGEQVGLSILAFSPLKDLTAIQHSLLSQLAPYPITAADLWEELETTAALMPTGTSEYQAKYLAVS